MVRVVERRPGRLARWSGTVAREYKTAGGALVESPVPAAVGAKGPLPLTSKGQDGQGETEARGDAQQQASGADVGGRGCRCPRHRSEW
eukprot:scaffold1770_cov375-Prasinococcus_capsulatus_cf.AAC.8